MLHCSDLIEKRGLWRKLYPTTARHRRRRRSLWSGTNPETQEMWTRLWIFGQMGRLPNYQSIVGAQIKPYWCNWHSSRIPRTPPAVNHMPFFGKSKSTPNLHWQNPVPWNDLEECLKIESLMEDMHQEYAYMFRPYQHFWCPTPLSLYQVLAELRLNK
jgi:hypothetical protein